MITAALVTALLLYHDTPAGIGMLLLAAYIYWRESRRDATDDENEAPFPTWLARLCFTRGYIRSILAGETPSLVSQLISSQRIFLLIAVTLGPLGYLSSMLLRWLGSGG